MNHENQAGRGAEHEQQPQAAQPPESGGERSPWDPDEQVGDIYQVSDERGGTPEITKLPDDQPETQQQPADSPRIWVGSWLDYNNGILYGDWIDASRDTDEVWADVAAMLAASPTARKYGGGAEDWGIFDHEGFGPLNVGEQETISFVTAVARGISEHGPAFAAWADVMEDEASLGGFADLYLGEYDSLEAYAEQLVDDLGYDELLDRTIPESLRPYVQINVAGLAQDMWLGGDIHVYHRDGGGVWLFDGRA